MRPGHQSWTTRKDDGPSPSSCCGETSRVLIISLEFVEHSTQRCLQQRAREDKASPTMKASFGEVKVLSRMKLLR